MCPRSLRCVLLIIEVLLKRGFCCVLNSPAILEHSFEFFCKAFKKCHLSSRTIKEFHFDYTHLLEVDGINRLKSSGYSIYHLSERS
jgi:hypothetical protein